MCFTKGQGGEKLNKLLSFAALIIVSSAICSLIIYGAMQFAPSNDAKNVAYTQYGYGTKTYEAFLEISGIPGSYPVEPHKDQIEIEEFSWSETNGGSVPGGTGAGRVEMEDFQFIFQTDPKASPKLFLACAEGQVLEEAILYVRIETTGGEETFGEFLMVTFNSVLISSFGTSGDTDTYEGERPLDAITIEYSRIHFSYNEGNSAGWDLPTNTSYEK